MGPLAHVIYRLVNRMLFFGLCTNFGELFTFKILFVRILTCLIHGFLLLLLAQIPAGTFVAYFAYFEITRRQRSIGRRRWEWPSVADAVGCCHGEHGDLSTGDFEELRNTGMERRFEGYNHVFKCFL